MPIFEYACRDCGREFEAFVTADRQPACPACEGANLTKHLSTLGMVGAGNGAKERAQPSFPAGACGAGGAGCACRMN